MRFLLLFIRGTLARATKPYMSKHCLVMAFFLILNRESVLGLVYPSIEDDIQKYNIVTPPSFVRIETSKDRVIVFFGILNNFYPKRDK